MAHAGAGNGVGSCAALKGLAASRCMGMPTNSIGQVLVLIVLAYHLQKGSLRALIRQTGAAGRLAVLTSTMRLSFSVARPFALSDGRVCFETYF